MPHPRFKNYRLPDRFGQWLGYKVKKVDSRRQRGEAELRIREDHLSSAGRVHGGVVSAFCDFACGLAVFSTLGPRDFCSTVELKVNYLKPLMLGDLLRAEAQVVFRGNRLCVIHTLLYCGRGKRPVAMATGTFNIISDKAKRP